MSNGTDADQCTVLLADDEELYRQFLEQALGFFGYKVVVAHNGKDLLSKALCLLQQGIPTVLVVDNQMPEDEGQMENQWMGFSTVVQLCESFPGIGPQVIFLSRWGTGGLPQDLLAKARELQLAEPDRWLNVHTPFATIKARLDRIIKSIAVVD
jgi:CheY-like chemotaxis protein